MKKNLRVCKNREFTEIIQKRKYAKVPPFALHYAPRKGSHARIGISVGKKTGNAVVRNRVKRQARAMIDAVFTFDEPCDFILIIRPSFTSYSFNELQAMLARVRAQALRVKKSAPQGDMNEKNAA